MADQDLDASCAAAFGMPLKEAFCEELSYSIITPDTDFVYAVIKTMSTGDYAMPFTRHAVTDLGHVLWFNESVWGPGDDLKDHCDYNNLPMPSEFKMVVSMLHRLL